MHEPSFPCATITASVRIAGPQAISESWEDGSDPSRWTDDEAGCPWGDASKYLDPIEIYRNRYLRIWVHGSCMCMCP